MFHSISAKMVALCKESGAWPVEHRRKQICALYICFVKMNFKSAAGRNWAVSQRSIWGVVLEQYFTIRVGAEDIVAIYRWVDKIQVSRIVRHLSGTVGKLDSVGNVWGFFLSILRIIVSGQKRVWSAKIIMYYKNILILKMFATVLSKYNSNWPKHGKSCDLAKITCFYGSYSMFYIWFYRCDGTSVL